MTYLVEWKNFNLFDQNKHNLDVLDGFHHLKQD